MDSSKPNLLKNYNVTGVQREAYKRNAERQRLIALLDVLDKPDATEEVNVRARGTANITTVSASLNRLGIYINRSAHAQARLFEPHQIYTTEMGEENIDLATSVIAFESEGTAGEGCDGVLILFKLSGAMAGEAQAASTARDLKFGYNCSYGGLATKDGITWLKFEGDKFILRTKQLSYDDPSHHDEILELTEELNTFMQVRQGEHNHHKGQSFTPAGSIEA